MLEQWRDIPGIPGYQASDLGHVRSVTRLVNHKNGVRTDNRADNLEWVTTSENAKHAFRPGGRLNPFLGKRAEQHPASKAVISICLTTGAEQRYACALDATREGFDSGAISRCCHGKSKFHAGRNWRFVDLNPDERAA